MTNKQRQQMSWLEYRASVTGKTVEELRQEMANRGKLGGHPPGLELTKEHKQRLSEARRQRGKPSAP